MHALHGNTSAAAGVIAGYADDADEDLEGLGELTEDDRMELMLGDTPLRIPLLVLWQGDDGSAAVAVPAGRSPAVPNFRSAWWSAWRCPAAAGHEGERAFCAAEQ